MSEPPFDPGKVQPLQHKVDEFELELFRACGPFRLVPVGGPVDRAGTVKDCDLDVDRYDQAAQLTINVALYGEIARQTFYRQRFFPGPDHAAAEVVHVDLGMGPQKCYDAIAPRPFFRASMGHRPEQWTEPRYRR